MHLVPANKVDYLPSSFGWYLLLLNGSEDLMIGIDSPVNIDSFITQEPFSRITSQGRMKPSLISIISPATKWSEDISFYPLLISYSIFKWPPSYLIYNFY